MPSIKIIAVPPLVMCALCVYVGFYYLVMYLRRRKHRENLTFSIACFSVACYTLTCVGLYNASLAIEGMFWQRGNFVSIVLQAVSFIVFITDYTHAALPRWIKIGTIILITTIPFSLFYTGPLGLDPAFPIVRSILLCPGFTITYYEVNPGPVLSLIMLISFIFYIKMLHFLFQYYRQTRHRGTFSILIAYVLFFIAVISDMLVASNVYRFIYTAEYIYMLIILTMAYSMLNRFVDLHHRVEELNLSLENRVQERINDLSVAMESLKTAMDYLWGEMMLAKKIQMVMLPDKPVISGHEIVAFMEPAAEVGGDYYDIIHAGDKDWIIIGDVSGHGVSAGLIMMMVQSSLHALLDEYPGFTPSQLISSLNKTITANIVRMKEDKYMTITAFSTTGDGVFDFSGRHQDILVYRSASGTVETITPEGQYLGLKLDISDRMHTETLTLAAGDIMMLFTDGITEAWEENPANEIQSSDSNMFGQERLAKILRENAQTGLGAIRDRVLDGMHNYELMDDVTLLLILRTT